MTRSVVVVVVVSAMLVLAQVPAEAATTVSPDQLRAILPDAVESGWTEVGIGVTGHLDGPISVEGMRAYYQYYSQTPDWINAALSIMQQNGFVAGYGREWYKPGTQEQLFESVYVYLKASGADNAMSSEKVANAQQASSVSYFSPGVASQELGELATTGSFHFASVAFVVGNAEYGAGRISPKNDLTPNDVVGQAKALAARVPGTIPITTLQSHPTSASATSIEYQVGQFAGDAIIGVLILGVIALLIALVLRSRRRYGPPAIALSVDGRYWWDGTGWQDSAFVAPAAAPRSPDGAYWWDGRSWRPMPSQPVFQR